MALGIEVDAMFWKEFRLMAADEEGRLPSAAYARRMGGDLRGAFCLLEARGRTASAESEWKEQLRLALGLPDLGEVPIDSGSNPSQITLRLEWCGV